jgi:hypothetical protein
VGEATKRTGVASQLHGHVPVMHCGFSPVSTYRMFARPVNAHSRADEGQVDRAGVQVWVVKDGVCYGAEIITPSVGFMKQDETVHKPHCASFLHNRRSILAW